MIDTHRLILIKDFDDNDKIYFDDYKLSKFKTYECNGQFLSYKDVSIRIELYYITDESNKTHLIPKDILDNYFITEQEYRKQKLIKINESR